MEILNKLSENLQDACCLVEAGFFFEEGGCYGMALALYEVFAHAKLPVQYVYSVNQGHALVAVAGQYFDYTGACLRPSDACFVSEAELRTIANAGGRNKELLFSDQTWASEAILVALN